jgi:hypothetical protein
MCGSSEARLLEKDGLEEAEESRRAHWLLRRAAPQLHDPPQALLPLADRIRATAVAVEEAGRPVEAKNLMVVHDQARQDASWESVLG